MQARMGDVRWYKRRLIALGLLACWAGRLAPARADEHSSTPTAGFVGDGRCGNPTCHGAPLPVTDAQKKNWQPWKSARILWLNRDHHARAYNTLRTPAALKIAQYMGIQATESDKCLVCHAPAATPAAESVYQRSDGVTCEVCHGPAEHWLEPHVQKDWDSKRAQYASLGFCDNRGLVQRADKCASCHVEIDHEIVAGGHPPLQFEVVAYGQNIKHWDDDRRHPGAFSSDPTLWAIGQVVGLCRTAAMIEHRTGEANYQSIAKFPHFSDKNCYQCHHKLIDDALRQAQGHHEMVDALLAVSIPDERADLTRLWDQLTAAVAVSPEAARDEATNLENWCPPMERRVAETTVDRDATRQILALLTSSGQRLKDIRRFDYQLPKDSNVTRIYAIGTPWWYTTGGPEQVVMAIESLYGPACGTHAAIDDDLRTLAQEVDRFYYRPEPFLQTLRKIDRKLCH